MTYTTTLGESAANGSRPEEAAVTDTPGAPKRRSRRWPPRPTGLDDGPLDLRNTWQVAVGSLLVPLGVIFILLAWYGAAHARVVQQQIPYLVSGAFIGLGAMVVGGLLYWAHWLYRIYDQSELLHREQMEMMQQLLAAFTAQSRSSSTPLADISSSTPLADISSSTPLADISSSTPLAGTGPATGASSPLDEVLSGTSMAGTAHTGSNPGATHASLAEPELVATATGSIYHRADCPIVATHGNDMRVVSAAEAATLHPCRLCSPPSTLSSARP